MATPSATSRNANGVLPISASQTTGQSGGKSSKSKAPLSGKKVVIRRLAPGMTEDEFWTILGDEWKVGNGKVDYARFSQGKVRRNPLKTSEPARCSLHVIRAEDLTSLVDTVQRSKWEDAKETFNDPCLVGPPCVEMSLLQKIPTGKIRLDPRQGTIDQDPEYQAFLESLTQLPTTTQTDIEAQTEDTSEAEPKVKTTALVDFINQKKANKAKEAAAAKSAKHARQESQGTGKGKGGQDESKKKGKDSKGDKDKDKDKDKPKEPVKLLTKKSAAQEGAESSKSGNEKSTAGKSTEEPTPKSRRAGIAAAAKILQRDLGLSPGSAHRRARQDAAKAEAAAKGEAGPKSSSSQDAKEQKEASTPETAATTAAAASPVASTANTAKGSGSDGSRRSRGNKASKQAASSDTTKGKAAENSGNTTKATPITTPVILLKKKDDSASTTENVASSQPASSTPTNPPTGPKAGNSKATSSSNKTSGSQASQKKSVAPPAVTPGATRAFVKHANPSQGVTEPLLKEAMGAFGVVTFVEIDKRKGFAYVDFADYESLAKAITASPVAVAQGTVQVLERKETKKPSQAPATTATTPASDKASSETPTAPANDRTRRGGRGRGRRGGGGGSGGGKDSAAGGPDGSSSTQNAPEPPGDSGPTGGAD